MYLWFVWLFTGKQSGTVKTNDSLVLKRNQIQIGLTIICTGKHFALVICYSFHFDYDWLYIVEKEAKRKKRYTWERIPVNSRQKMVDNYSVIITEKWGREKTMFSIAKPKVGTQKNVNEDM